MTNKEFQEWLKRFPDDTTIQVAEQLAPLPYTRSGDVRFVNFNQGDGEHYYYNERMSLLELGSSF